MVSALIDLFHNVARKQGYSDSYLATVVRSSNHPFKPANFPDINKVHECLGFVRTNIYELWLWPTRCGVPENERIALIDNMVQYWHNGHLDKDTHSYEINDNVPYVLM